MAPPINSGLCTFQPLGRISGAQAGESEVGMRCGSEEAFEHGRERRRREARRRTVPSTKIKLVDATPHFTSCWLHVRWLIRKWYLDFNKYLQTSADRCSSSEIR